MRRNNPLLAVLMFTLLACFASDAHAVYHPKLGRWMQQDPLGRDTTMQQRLGTSAMPTSAFVPRDSLSPTPPGAGYHDGMNLYEYVGSNPIRNLDWSGEEIQVVGLTTVPVIIIHDVEEYKKAIEKAGGVSTAVTGHKFYAKGMYSWDPVFNIVAKFDPKNPCSCEFRIKSLKMKQSITVPGIGAKGIPGVPPRTRQRWRLTFAHEWTHYRITKTVVETFAAAQEYGRECKYGRALGLLPSKQSQAKCNKRARILRKNLVDRLGGLAKDPNMDWETSSKHLNTMKDMKKAAKKAVEAASKITANDWSCSDTVGHAGSF